MFSYQKVDREEAKWISPDRQYHKQGATMWKQLLVAEESPHSCLCLCQDNSYKQEDDPGTSSPEAVLHGKPHQNMQQVRKGSMQSLVRPNPGFVTGVTSKWLPSELQWHLSAAEIQLSSALRPHRWVLCVQDSSSSTSRGTYTTPSRSLNCCFGALWKA